MPASLYRVSADQCLVSSLLRELRAIPPEELSDTLLILPTQRLGTYVLASLLTHHAALIPPRILTLEQVLSLGAPQSARTVGEGALDLLLARLLEAGGYRHLRSGHERELRLLYGELFDQGQYPQALEALKQALREDIYRSEEHLGSLYDRATEIEHILAKLHNHLAERSLACRQQSLALSAQTLAQSWYRDPFPAKHYVIAAYTSLAQSWQGLLEVWSQDPRFAFWVSEAPELFHATSPLLELNIRLQKIMDVKIVPPLVQDSKQLVAASAPNPLEEVRWALRCIQELLDRGFQPESLALLVTDEARYAPLLKGALSEMPWESNLALAFPFAGSIPGRCLTALEQLWTEEEDLPSLLRCFAEVPVRDYLASVHPLEDLAVGASECLEELILATQIPRGLDRLKDSLEEPWKQWAEVFAQLVAPLHPRQKKTLALWLQALEQWIIRLDLWNSEPDPDWKRSCEEVFQQFKETLSVLADENVPMAGTLFWQLVRSHLLAQDIRSTGEPLHGVQVLIVTEARYFPFQAAVLLGCQEGSFPKALPQDELVDNYLKKAMGLPGWESLEAMEDQTFHLLKSRLPQLLLLRSLRLGEEMLQRSRFTESYLIKSGKKELAWPSAPLDSQAFTPEELTLTPEGAWSESGELLRTSMSASRLEHLIRCPYSFLLHALGVRGQEPPPAWGDSRREGEWLHAILEALITGKNKDKTILDPWPQESTERIAEEALQRLTHLSHLLAPPELRFSAFFTHLVETAWPKFAQHLANLWQGVPSYPAHREYKIETRGSQIAKVQVGSKERFLQGRIDAIDPGPHWMHVTDYKRRSPPALREGRDGSAPQLAFYALALQQLEPHWVARGLVFGYWNIAKGEWTAQAVSSQARGPAENAGFTKKDCPDMEDLTQDLLRIWQWREEELDAAGRYYADTSACKLCSYSGICRKEDPRVEALLKDQQRLAQYRKEVSSAD